MNWLRKLERKKDKITNFLKDQKSRDEGWKEKWKYLDGVKVKKRCNSWIICAGGMNKLRWKIKKTEMK